MNRKFISKSNRVLRKVLNSKENLDILQNFIESFLEIKIQKIQLNSYLRSKSNYLPEEENFGIADVRIVLTNQEEINVGIQFIDGSYVQNKLLLYYAQIHTNQLAYQDGRKLTRTITINLLDFKYFNAKEYHKKILIKSNTDANKMSETIELHVIELPKYETKKVMSLQDAWMVFLRGEEDMDYSMVIEKYDKIKKLNQLLNQYWEEEKIE